MVLPVVTCFVAKVACRTIAKTMGRILGVDVAIKVGYGRKRFGAGRFAQARAFAKKRWLNSITNGAYGKTAIETDRSDKRKWEQNM